MDTKIRQLPIAGFSQVDGDRLRFACYIQECKSACNDGDERKIDEIITEIIDYLVDDFRKEESLMKKHDYPDFGDHLRAHANFFVYLREARRLGKRETVEFIERWFINHTLRFDVSLGQFLKEKA